MQRLGYILLYPIIWFISVLPFPLLYAFSDFIFIVVYYVVGYRKNLVSRHLRMAFPEKKPAELKAIRKKFYHHFCDIFLEMIKTLSISDKALKKRFVITNPEEINRLETLNKSYIIMLGHYASYEWINALNFYGMSFKTYGAYKKIKNKYFDKLIRKIRSRYNTSLLPSKIVVKEIVRNNAKKELGSYAMIADQAPKRGKSKYARKFMGAKVPVFVGSEVIAKRLDFAVTYLHVEKVKRGHYKASFIPLADKPKEFSDYTITDKYFNYLEAQIRKEPAYYLWTHDRWKHQLD